MLPAVLVALPALAITAARLLGGGMHTPLPQLAAMSFWAIPLWLVAFGLLLLARAWPALAVPVLALALHGYWVMPTFSGTPIVDGTQASGGAQASGGTQASGGQVLRVLSFNAHLGEADPAAIAAAARQQRVDLLIVVELTGELQQQLGPLLAPDFGYSSGTGRFGPAGTGMWSRRPLTELPPQEGTTFGTVRARLDLGGDRTVAVTAVHTVSPRPGQVQRWLRDLALIRQTASSTEGQQIIAGDFNAGRDHRAFRELLDVPLADAADVRGRAGWPGFTWPADRPGPPLTRIDHVLVTPGSVGASGVQTLRLPGSDHLAVLATLVVRR